MFFDCLTNWISKSLWISNRVTPRRRKLPVRRCASYSEMLEDRVVLTAAIGVGIEINSSALIAGQTAQVTFEFDQLVSGFDVSDVTAENGALSNFQTADSINWVATFTPNAGVQDLSNAITLDLSLVQDGSQQPGTGVASSSSFAIDTLEPGAEILVAGPDVLADGTAILTITFNEPVIGFSNADLTVESGTLSTVVTSDGGITWTAILTPALNTTAVSNLVTLNYTGVTDLAGNSGTGVGTSNNYLVDTVRPTATIEVNDAGEFIDGPTLVTITFNEYVIGLTEDDFTVSNGTLTSLLTADNGVTWTATFAPTPSVVQASNVISLDGTLYADENGNAGVGTATSNSFSIDANLAPTDISLSAAGVNEGAANGTVIGTFSGTDPDSGDTLTFSLLTDAGGRFAISGTSLVVANGAALDFEIVNSYEIEVRVTDSYNHTYEESFTINVLPVNDNSPVFISEISFNVAENSTAVGTVIATDVDSPLQTITYTVSGGADAARFTITEGGALSFVTGPDFEIPTDNGTNNIYEVIVNANDGQGGETTQAISVTVTGVNDNTPHFANASPTFSLEENSPIVTAVGSVSATDGDLPTQGLTYAIISGNELEAFAINPTTGAITVADPAQLNFEVTSSFSLVIRVTDNATPQALTADATVQINILNVDEGTTITIPEENEADYTPRSRNVFVSPEMEFSLGSQSNVNFAGAKLTATIISGRGRRDTLTLVSDRTGASGITVRARKLFYQGVQVGTIKPGGKNGTADIEVTFNSSANAAAVEGSLRRIAFFTTSDIGMTRTVQFRISGGEGVASNTVTREISVVDPS